MIPGNLLETADTIARALLAEVEQRVQTLTALKPSLN
jgi:hypothetical protein